MVAVEKVFQAANGSKVRFDGSCNVALGVKVKDENGKQRSAVFQVQVLVGDSPYNILSTCQLGKKGWKIFLGEGIEMSHDKWKIQLVDTLMWCETPWVRVFPYHGTEVVWETEDSSLGTQLNALKRVVGPLSAEELQIHRIKGHNPFHPSCPDCIKAKGVSQHRRKTNRGLETTVCADFMFLSCKGEIVPEIQEDSPEAKKVQLLALREEG